MYLLPREIAKYLIWRLPPFLKKSNVFCMCSLLFSAYLLGSPSLPITVSLNLPAASHDTACSLDRDSACVVISLDAGTRPGQASPTTLATPKSSYFQNSPPPDRQATSDLINTHARIAQRQQKELEPFFFVFPGP